MQITLQILCNCHWGKNTTELSEAYIGAIMHRLELNDVDHCNNWKTTFTDQFLQYAYN